LLALDPDAHFVALSRRPHEVAAHGGRVHPLAGDLRLPALGVDESVWAQLRPRLTAILHCAAEIRFDLPLDDARQTNVEGTRTILNLARRCPRLDRLAHISTTYISGQSPEPLPEGPFTNRHGFFSSYQESKYEAEHLALEAALQLPLAVYRLSTVIGDSASGKVEQYNHFHQLLRLVQHNPLPVLPGSPEAKVDFVATDWTASSIAWSFHHAFQPGSIRNFSAGPSNTLAMPLVLEMAFDALGRGKAPELVSWDDFHHYTRARLGRGEERIAQLLQSLSYFLPYFSLQQRFENDQTLASLDARLASRPDSVDLFARVLGFMKRTAAAPASSHRPVPARETVG
jgi:nucleoside-diphosphate-sugar epimerase